MPQRAGRSINIRDGTSPIVSHPPWLVPRAVGFLLDNATNRKQQIEGSAFLNRNFSISKIFLLSEQKHFEFRTEFFNIWNHVNPLFEPVGLIGEEPQPLEFGTPQFGFAQGARDPRFIQLAVKFYF